MVVFPRPSTRRRNAARDHGPRDWRETPNVGDHHRLRTISLQVSQRPWGALAAGFSPRKAATTVYLPDGVGVHADLLEGLGPHATGVGWLYIKDLDSVDLQVLESILARSYAAVTADTYMLRAGRVATPEVIAVPASSSSRS
jgi:hypothetical protein